MTAPKAILVTGCAGFIGSNFCKQFRQKYPDTLVVGIDDLSTGRRDEIHTDVKFYEGSILDADLLEKIFSTDQPEYVFHFAALPRVSFSVEQPRLTTEVNIVGTVTLLEAARKHGVKRVTYSASSSVYGGAKKFPTKESENPPAPKSPYAVQKYTNELFSKVFASLYDMDTVCLRYFNVFGPGQYGDSAYASVLSAWLEALYFPERKKAFLEGDGEQSRDFCYIDNVVMANMLAMESDRRFNGESMNIAHGERTTVNEMKELLEEYTGRKLDLERRPTRVGDVKDSHADISLAKELLGYDPQVNFREGLKKTIAWFEERAKTES